MDNMELQAGGTGLPVIPRMEEERTVNVYNVRAATPLTQIRSNASMFGHLVEDFREMGIEYNPETMLVTESVNYTTLDMPESRLPRQSFILSINMRDTKGGK